MVEWTGARRPLSSSQVVTSSRLCSSGTSFGLGQFLRQDVPFGAPLAMQAWYRSSFSLSLKQLTSISSGQSMWQARSKNCVFGYQPITCFTVLMWSLAFSSARESLNLCLRAVMKWLKFRSSGASTLWRVTIHHAAALTRDRVMTLTLPLFLGKPSHTLAHTPVAGGLIKFDAWGVPYDPAVCPFLPV